jgi:hypothetical protein
MDIYWALLCDTNNVKLNTGRKEETKGRIRRRKKGVKDRTEKRMNKRKE